MLVENKVTDRRTHAYRERKNQKFDSLINSNKFKRAPTVDKSKVVLNLSKRKPTQSAN